jgi:predicted dehydrogenase
MDLRIQRLRYKEQPELNVTMKITRILKVAIIGAGYMGKKRAEVIRNSAGGQLEVICDIDTKKARQLSHEYGCSFTGDWRKVVRNKTIDVVVVATTNDKLATISIAALKQGKHVLCEKPLGRNFREAQKIYAAAVKNRVQLKTGFNHRFHPAISRAFQMFRKGAIGKIMFIRAVYGHGARAGYDRQWRMNPKVSGGGELLDQGSHIIDLFRLFLGEFKEAMAVNDNLFWKHSPLEDNSFILLKTKDGKIASAHLSTTQWKNKFLFEIFGNKGYLIIEGLGKSYGQEKLIYGRRMSPGAVPLEEKIKFKDEDVSWALEWKDFMAAIRKNRQPQGLGLDGLKANEILSALYKSGKQKRAVKIGGRV